MKILHTSDWHIGKKLYEKSIDSTLNFFFDWLIETIKTEKIDILLVAGDIFNNPYPSQTALSLYYKTLYELSKTQLKQVIIIGGNHDSASNLNAPKELLDVLNIKVIGGVPENTDDMIIQINENSDKPSIIVAAVPFLREKDIRIASRGLSYDEHKKSISLGIENFYKQIAQKIKTIAPVNVPIIAMGHLFVINSKNTENNDNDYYLGGLQQISLNQLPDNFDYWALGHIHKPLTVSKKQNVYYSGSPIHTSFDAVTNKNRVLIIETNNENLSVKSLEIPKFRNLVRFAGNFEYIAEQLLAYKNDKKLMAWADVQIIEPKKILDLDSKIEELKQKLTEIEIINFSYNFTEVEEKINKKFVNTVELKDLKPLDIFTKIIDNVEEQDQKLLLDTFKELMENYITYEN
jgi:exonuclease SbcD